MSVFDRYGLAVFDNGGGVTLKLGVYSHSYDTVEQAARDLAEWLRTGSTDGWAGHEIEALQLDPTAEQIRNGGYRVLPLDRYVDSVASLAAELRAIGWGNADDLAGALAEVAS